MISRMFRAVPFRDCSFFPDDRNEAPVSQYASGFRVTFKAAISDVFRKPTAVFFFPEPPELPSIKGDLRTLPDEIVSS